MTFQSLWLLGFSAKGFEFSIGFWEAVTSSWWFSMNLSGLCGFICSAKEYALALGPSNTAQTVSI